ncbi:hypothetical protein [Paludisphaera rhizosphaerae]|uniref:hypothetical protein n=1 Tax=Paludisphaera rhizosphaerae TaxID=2711216 RepID=UPI0013ECA0EF|nr:hypothetical protein [Paludisphaera rhizosphaerae]
MPARSRRILLNLFAIAYGIVAIAGPALHALPGLGHEGPSCVHRDGVSSCPDSRPVDAHHDCVVCHVQAQSSLHLDADGSLIAEIIATQPPDEPPLVSPAPIEAPSSPRAPPTLA